MASLLFNVSPYDPLVFLAVPCVDRALSLPAILRPACAGGEGRSVVVVPDELKAAPEDSGGPSPPAPLPPTPPPGEGRALAEIQDPSRAVRSWASLSI